MFPATVTEERVNVPEAFSVLELSLVRRSKICIKFSVFFYSVTPTPSTYLSTVAVLSIEVVMYIR